eukprot:CAMPEP_0119315024 /NCGR_PEP_ID=MMETSP1333-20130426/34181_1 /TAXON_ID=418940 /ORGANISM="Scyphosphaera apsteinii, Strain RCC1455" /LENGTH=199 /DNA_ID=CAMNT_0007320241 /DNA_START=52 /DNA_END=651 /DNA_ORIENTATION=+
MKPTFAPVAYSNVENEAPAYLMQRFQERICASGAGGFTCIIGDPAILSSPEHQNEIHMTKYEHHKGARARIGPCQSLKCSMIRKPITSRPRTSSRQVVLRTGLRLREVSASTQCDLVGAEYLLVSREVVDDEAETVLDFGGSSSSADAGAASLLLPPPANDGHAQTWRTPSGGFSVALFGKTFRVMVEDFQRPAHIFGS